MNENCNINWDFSSTNSLTRNNRLSSIYSQQAEKKKSLDAEEKRAKSASAFARSDQDLRFPVTEPSDKADYIDK